MTKSIVAFCGETFYKSDFNLSSYVAKPTSAAFLQDTFGCDNVYVVSPYVDQILKGTSSTEVKNGFFYRSPIYSSTKDFFVKSLLNPSFYRDFLSFCDEVINEHKNSLFWIRTPSIGSIIFGLRALKHNQRVLHHMCADASNTWKDAKYKGLNKFLAFIISRFLRLLLKKICSHPNTINFCTGDVLEKFSKQYSDKTFQFVDVMTKSVDTSGFPKPIKTDKRKKLLFVGRMVEDKGIFDLIDVISELREYYTLTFIGDGSDLGSAKEMVAGLNLTDTVHFTGQVPHNSLGQFFYSSDLVAVPSNNNYEGFPRVIMEAWSFNKPVIVSDVGGINAFVRSGVNGIVIEPGNIKELKQALINCGNDSYYQSLCVGAENMASKSLQSYWIRILKEKVSNLNAQT